MATFSLCLHVVFPVCVSVCVQIPPFIDTGHIGLGPPGKTLFPNKMKHKGLGLPTYLFGRHNSTHTGVLSSPHALSIPAENPTGTSFQPLWSTKNKEHQTYPLSWFGRSFQPHLCTWNAWGSEKMSCDSQHKEEEWNEQLSQSKVALRSPTELLPQAPCPLDPHHV